MTCLPEDARVGLSRNLTPASDPPKVTSMLSNSMLSVRTEPFWPPPDTPTRVVAFDALAFWKVCPPSVEYWTSSVVAKLRMIGSGQSAHGGTGQNGGHGCGGMRWMNQRVMM